MDLSLHPLLLDQHRLVALSGLSACVDGQVAMCTFHNGLLAGGELLAGHGWAGGAKPFSGGSLSIPGPSSATEISWRFFKEYAW